MSLVKAFYAFYRRLFEPECVHALVKPLAGGSICPECGYQVQIIWHLIRCRSCGSKRHTKRTPDNAVRPLYKYCQHCGGTDYQLVKREHIQVYEVPYAVCSKEVNYLEPVPEYVSGRPRYPAAHNPFERRTRPVVAQAIVEGVVLKKTELIRAGLS